MILTCERCQARYEIDETRLGSAGRTVRCTSCSHSWHQVPIAETAADAAEKAAAASASDEAVEVETAAEPDPLVAPKRARPRTVPPPAPKVDIRKQALKWGAIAAPTIALIVGLGAARNMIVAAWPPAARLYAMVGAPAPATAPGLAVRAIHTEEQTIDGHRTLLVSGEVANIGADPRHLPMLHATLAQGEKVTAHWSFPTEMAELAPGQATPFHTQFPDVPEGAVSVTVGLWR
jgi:predicted Zn finger-like uncharacterized protein